MWKLPLMSHVKLEDLEWAKKQKGTNRVFPVKFLFV